MNKPSCEGFFIGSREAMDSVKGSKIKKAPTGKQASILVMAGA
jgi:hypothetical protein